MSRRSSLHCPSAVKIIRASILLYPRPSCGLCSTRKVYAAEVLSMVSSVVTTETGPASVVICSVRTVYAEALCFMSALAYCTPPQYGDHGVSRQSTILVGLFVI